MKKLIPGLIYLAIFIPSVIIYYNYSTGKTEKYFEALNKEYPSITINEKIDDRIISILSINPQISRGNPHKAYFVLERAGKKRVFGFNSKEDFVLDDVLEVGSRLIKESHSDRFFIYNVQENDTLKYEFELEDDLGYPLYKQKMNESIIEFK